MVDMLKQNLSKLLTNQVKAKFFLWILQLTFPFQIRRLTKIGISYILFILGAFCSM